MGLSMHVFWVVCLCLFACLLLAAVLFLAFDHRAAKSRSAVARKAEALLRSAQQSDALTSDVLDEIQRSLGAQKSDNKNIFLDFPHVEQLSVDAAERLLELSASSLSLPAVRALPVEVAERLCRYEGHLTLGLRALTEELCQVMSSFQGASLRLKDIEERDEHVESLFGSLNPPFAEEKAAQHDDRQDLGNSAWLIKYESVLQLPGPIQEALFMQRLSRYASLSELEPAQAYEMIGIVEAFDPRAALVLDHISSLSPSLARALCSFRGKNEGEEMRMHGIQRSSETTRSIDRISCQLHLNGVQELSLEVAQALAELQGDLHLDGMIEIDAPTLHALFSLSGGNWRLHKYINESVTEKHRKREARLSLASLSLERNDHWPVHVELCEGGVVLHPERKGKHEEAG